MDHMHTCSLFQCRSNRYFVSLIKETSETALFLRGNAHQGHSPAGVNVSLRHMVLKWHCFLSLTLEDKDNHVKFLPSDGEEQLVRSVCPRPCRCHRFDCVTFVRMFISAKVAVHIIRLTLCLRLNNS